MTNIAIRIHDNETIYPPNRRNRFRVWKRYEIDKIERVHDFAVGFLESFLIRC